MYVDESPWILEPDWNTGTLFHPAPAENDKPS